MTITFEAVVDDVAYDLNNGSPFRLGSMQGASSSSVERYGRRDALWGGLVDDGYRLTPREITVSLHFYATTDATLDTYRQQLFAIFCPLPHIPIYLRITRDDGEIRILETYTTGTVVIDYLPEERAAHLHRATVILRAAQPTWRAATQTVNTTLGSSAPDEWWLAGGAIGTANVLEHVEYPTQGQAWSAFSGAHNFYTIAFRTAPDDNTQGRTAFRHGTADAALDPKLWRLASSWSITASETGTANLPGGERNYFYWANVLSGDRILLYDADSVLDSFNGSFVDLTNFGAWRGDRTGAGSTLWTREMPAAAIYNTTLDSSQRNALSTYMSQTSTFTQIAVVNSGDIPVSPLITLIGPLTNPLLTNTTTGQVINLTGLSLGSAEVCYIDLTTGHKTITNVAGSSLLSYMGTPAQLANFYLAPDPIATGGTNYMSLTGGSATTNTSIEFRYYDRYMSF